MRRQHESIPIVYGAHMPSIQELLVEYDRSLDYTSSLIDGLTDDEIVWRPEENASSVGWHLIHQPAVAHYMVRNLTAAELRIDPELELLADSATPPPERGDLPSVDRIVSYRDQVANRVRVLLGKIASGDVGAPKQLGIIGAMTLASIVNHEYQHSTWIGESRVGPFGHAPIDTPTSDLLIVVEGYPVIDLSR